MEASDPQRKITDPICDICMAPHDMNCRQCTFNICLHCFYSWDKGCPQCRLDNWAVQDLSIIQTIDLTFD